MRQHRNQTKDLLYVLPAFIAICLFTYYPLIELIRISFSNWNLVSESSSFVGLDNYEWLFSGTGSKYLWNSFRITLLYSLFEIAFTVVGGLLLALLLNGTSRILNVARAVIFIPRYISMSCAAVIFLWMLNTDYGVLNKALLFFGGEQIDWLGKSFTAFLSIVAVSAWRNIGYGMIMYISALSCIPNEFYEAAKMDRASKFSTFFSVTLPQVLPTAEFLALTSFLAAMKQFQTVDIMTGGGPMRSTEMIVCLIYRYAIVDFRMGRAAAVAIILFISLAAITAVFLIASRYFKKIYGT